MIWKRHVNIDYFLPIFIDTVKILFIEAIKIFLSSIAVYHLLPKVRLENKKEM
jgi:hypothetical protein